METKIRQWLEKIGRREDYSLDPWRSSSNELSNVLSPLSNEDIDDLCEIISRIANKRTSTGVLYSDIIHEVCTNITPLPRSKQDRLNSAALIFTVSLECLL